MIRLKDNHCGKDASGQLRGALIEQKEDGFYSCSIGKNAASIWTLLDQYKGMTVKALKDAGVIVFTREHNLDSNDLTFYEITEKKGTADVEPPQSFRIETGNLMGVLCLRHDDGTCLKMQIGSRFDDGGKQFFLNYMLSRVFDVNFAELVSSGDSSMWDMLLAFVFLWHFEKAAEIGLYKQYHKCEYNDLNFRGRVDLDRHIKRNYPLCDRIAYSTRDITYDNPVNHLLRSAAAKIEKKWPTMLERHESVRSLLLQLKQNTPTWDAFNNTMLLNCKETLQEVHHPFFSEYYEPLRKVARMLLTDEGANIFDSESSRETEISGVVFDGSWLWEEYLATILVPIDFYHADTSKSSTGIHVFENNTLPLYPDFRFPRNPNVNKHNCSAILDAKYKRGDALQSKDVHQVLCYMFLTGATIGGLIYPPICNGEEIKTEEQEWEIIHSVYGTKESKLQWRCFTFSKINQKDEKQFWDDLKNKENDLVKFAKECSSKSCNM